MCFTTLADSLEDLLSVLVELELGDYDFAGVNTNWNALTIGFLSSDSFDVDEVLQSVDRGDFSFSAFLGSSNYENFVVLADGNASDLVL